MGDVDELRDTLATLKEAGLLDRVASIGAGFVSFHPAPPVRYEPSQADKDSAAEKIAEAADAHKQHVLRGAVGGFRPTGTIR